MFCWPSFLSFGYDGKIRIDGRFSSSSFFFVKRLQQPVCVCVILPCRFYLFILQLIRRRRQHQRKPLPLTEEMLNELNKNHMSGVENTGGDSFYNDDVGDAWDHRTNFPTKPIKVNKEPPFSSSSCLSSPFFLGASVNIQCSIKIIMFVLSLFAQPLPRPASVSAIRTHGSGGASYNYNHYTNYNNFRPQLHDTWKSEWDSSYYDHSNSSTAQRSKTAPRPATSYGRYPTYGRSRPAYHDDF